MEQVLKLNVELTQSLLQQLAGETEFPLRALNLGDSPRRGGLTF